jgi:hypothetical protein
MVNNGKKEKGVVEGKNEKGYLVVGCTLYCYCDCLCLLLPIPNPMPMSWLYPSGVRPGDADVQKPKSCTFARLLLATLLQYLVVKVACFVVSEKNRKRRIILTADPSYPPFLHQ